MIYGSVCSGIEAASVAWESLGWKPLWFAEVDSFPSAVLAHRFPDTPNLWDMKQLSAKVLSMQVAAPEVIVGGTPCQAFSVAGLRNSLNDDREQLSIAFIHLADAVDAVRRIRGEEPAIIVWENVHGVLNTKDNAFGCFLGALAGEDGELQPPGKRWENAGCVFGPARAIAWRVLDAQYFGLAQRRRRVFVVASARDGFHPAKVLFEFDGMRRDFAPSRKAGEETAGALASRTDGGGFPGTDEARSGYVQPVASTGHVSHCPNAGGMGRIDYETKTMIVHGTQDPCISESTAFALGRNNGGENAVMAFSCKDYGADAGELAPTLAGSAVRRLTPREYERLHGFPDDYTLIQIRGKPAADGPRYKALGNSMAVPVMRWIGRRIAANASTNGGGA